MEKIWLNTQNLGVELVLGCKATQLDPLKKYLRDERGDEYSFDKILLAMSGSPNRLPYGDDDIVYYRDLQDYHHLRALCERGENFLIIGSGFIGSEIAAALTMIGKKSVMVFPEDTIGAKIFPNDLSNYMNDFYRQKGVEVVSADSVASLEKNANRFTVHTLSGHTFEKGVVYYLEQSCVRSVLLWNVWNQVDNARALIAEAETFKVTDLIGGYNEPRA